MYVCMYVYVSTFCIIRFCVSDHHTSFRNIVQVVVVRVLYNTYYCTSNM